MQVIELPKAYSEADSALRERTIKAIEAIKTRYKEEIEPLTQVLVDIENRYPARLMLVPAAPSASDS